MLKSRGFNLSLPYISQLFKLLSPFFIGQFAWVYMQIVFEHSIDIADKVMLETTIQNATATIVLTIANHRTVTSSIMSPDKEKSYYLVNLTESIAGMLHLFTNGNYAPLVRTLWKKVETGTVDYECYEMRFSTAYKCDYSPRKQKIDVVPNVTVE